MTASDTVGGSVSKYLTTTSRTCGRIFSFQFKSSDDKTVVLQ